jgi:Flp pilus assembly protein TadB
MAEENKQNNEEAKAVEQPTALTVSPPTSATTQNSRPPNINIENALFREALEAFKVDAEARKTEAEATKLEIPLKEKELEHSAAFASESLQVQAKDLSEQRTESRIQRRDYLLASGIALILFLVFFVICIYTGNKDVAMEIIKIGGAALISGVSAYKAGKSKGKEEAKKESDS